MVNNAHFVSHQSPPPHKKKVIYNQKLLCDYTKHILVFRTAPEGLVLLDRLQIRGELSYLAPIGSENISAPYFKQCFFRVGGDYPPLDSQTPRLPVPRQK